MRLKWREPISFREICNRFALSTLRSKLVGVMLALSFVCVLVLIILDSQSIKEIVKAVQNQNEDLSQAFQISIDEITTQGFTNQARLQDFIATLNRKGVREISILSNERQVLESSNPNKVGKVIPPKHKDFLITGAIGEDEGEEGAKRKIYNLVIPVVVKNEQLGYINLKLHLEDFDQLLDSLRVRRLIAIIVVFGLGVAGSLFLASRYTRPIGALVESARRVAAGDLSRTIPIDQSIKNDEVGELTNTFNEMVERLRENQVLQQKLAKAEHMSRLGQLSAGIAHEIRNPLNYLSLSLDHLRDNLAKGGDTVKMKESVVRMKQEILRLSHLMKNFLSYGKPLKLNKAPVEVDTLIDDSLQMVNDTIADQRIKINRDIEDGLKFFGDREHLKSCISNVLLNAVQALSSGGSLDISVKSDPLSSSAVVIIKDDGEGIDPDKLKHIGEPFFTTKEGGVGVGLAMTKKILSEHDGSFEITSEGRNGTTVKMIVPLG